jgi:hypothetical protein
MVDRDNEAERVSKRPKNHKILKKEKKKEKRRYLVSKIRT